jgi:acid phosphatase family membrane protein YuiD
MLIALLVNANVAFMSSIVIGFFIGLIAGGKMDVTLVMIVGGFTGAYVARNARRRSKIILAGTLSVFSR